MVGTTRQTAVRGSLGAVDAPRARSARDGRRWSLRFGRAFGIELYAHVTFLVLIVWSGATSLATGQGLAGAVAGMGFVAAVFAIVILHELGHALAARSFGIPTRDITLYPFGGVASLERMPREPKQELAIAVAGPAVNVALALLFGALSVAFGSVPLSFAIGLSPGSVLASLAGINVTLAVFNMLPAFPMDGGRVFRAFLALRLDFARATEVAVRLGQFMAVALALVGVLMSPMLMVIGVFVWLGGQAELVATRLRTALEGVPTAWATLTDFPSLGSQQSLAEASRLVLQSGARAIAVLEGGRVIGVVTRQDVIRGLASTGEHGEVASIVRGAIVEATPEEPILDVVERISRAGADLAVVSRDGRLVGVVTLDILENLVLLRGALRGPSMARTMQTSVA